MMREIELAQKGQAAATMRSTGATAIMTQKKGADAFVRATHYDDEDDGLLLDFVIDAGTCMYVCMYVYPSQDTCVTDSVYHRRRACRSDKH